MPAGLFNLVMGSGRAIGQHLVESAGVEADRVEVRRGTGIEALTEVVAALDGTAD